MSNPAFKPSEGKREEFRKYLEKNGVMDALTKVLVNLYEEPEKPEDALEYIRDRLSIQAGIDTYSQMKSKLEDHQTRIESLTSELDELKAGMAGPAEGVEEENPAGPDETADPPAEDGPPPEPVQEEQPAENPE